MYSLPPARVALIPLGISYRSDCWVWGYMDRRHNITITRDHYRRQDEYQHDHIIMCTFYFYFLATFQIPFTCQMKLLWYCSLVEVSIPADSPDSQIETVSQVTLSFVYAVLQFYGDIFVELNSSFVSLFLALTRPQHKWGLMIRIEVEHFSLTYF